MTVQVQSLSDEARLLAVLLKAAGRYDLPVTHRQVALLAGELAAWAAQQCRPPDEDDDAAGSSPGSAAGAWRPGSAQSAITRSGPTVEQVNVLVEKARSRALSGAEVERLVAGVKRLRVLADPLGPLQVPCGRCGVGAGRWCLAVGGLPVRPHRVRVELWLAG